jgi:1-phosphofructokinase family hexose kinase
MPTGVLVAGPNLTIDRTASLEELRPGAVLRFSRVVVTPGGKGLNVARAARCLGVDALLVGFVPGATGRAGAGLIEREGIALRGVECGGELRSTAIVMERGGRTTVFNEPGPRIGVEDWEAFEAAVAGSLPGRGVLVCSGSVPPGSPDDAYGRLARLAAGPCVVDAGGVTLARALEAAPAVVCPNVVEAEEVVGVGEGDAPPRAVAAAAALVERGARAAVVTADAAGAAVAAGGERFWIPAPRIAAVRNPVGAGDVFACGLAAALERGEPVVAAARFGIAAAAASVEWPTAGQLDPLRAAELLRSVTPALVNGGH